MGIAKCTTWLLGTPWRRYSSFTIEVMILLATLHYYGQIQNLIISTLITVYQGLGYELPFYVLPRRPRRHCWPCPTTNRNIEDRLYY